MYSRVHKMILGRCRLVPIEKNRIILSSTDSKIGYDVVPGVFSLQVDGVHYDF